MRLIDADALKAEWYRLNDINEEDCGARFVGYQEIIRLINNAPTVEPTGDYISRADAIEAVRSYFKDRLGKSKCDYDEELQLYVLGKEERTMLTYNKGINDKLRSLPSAEAVTIHEDGTLEIKVPNAHKVGRVLVTDVDSHIGGGLFYPDEAVQGEWIEVQDDYDNIYWECSNCEDAFVLEVGTPKDNHYNFCPNCGADMRGEEA